MMALFQLNCIFALVAFMSTSLLVLGDRNLLLRSSRPKGKSTPLSLGGAADGAETCADLKNMNTHFAVEVEVGTPPQKFDLVADTGSGAVIVTSCACVDEGYCPKKDRCFRGTDKSSTFALLNGTDGNSSGPMAATMTFGSGSVTSVIASDVVSVGGQKANLENGLLLMVDRRELRIDGVFEGILGLGPKDTMANPTGGGMAPPPLTASKAQSNTSARSLQPKLFLQEANVDRYSLCFNDGSKPGALRLNVPEFQNPVKAIGTFHWGLGLYGLSVGTQDAPSLFCEKSMNGSGTETPCGAIPDSGTTLMMGPKDQVNELFGSLCKNWDRCATAKKDTLKNMSDSHAFQTLLYNCADWVTDEHSIDEVPSVFLTVGTEGDLRKLEISPWAYIVETQQEQTTVMKKLLFGVIPVELPVPTGKMQKVCMPSFGVQTYNTPDNGPVWILGTPLFYQYNVGYELSGPRMSFDNTKKCSMCNETAPSLLSSERHIVQPHKKLAPPMRRMTKDPRVTHFDTSVPL